VRCGVVFWAWVVCGWRLGGGCFKGGWLDWRVSQEVQQKQEGQEAAAQPGAAKADWQVNCVFVGFLQFDVEWHGYSHVFHPMNLHLLRTGWLVRHVLNMRRRL
jgi:hypothetical protein